MNSESPLENKAVLVVDDEPDILETLEEELYMCKVYKALDYDAGLQYLLGYTWDAVILDIMGVDGFKLLKTSVSLGFPTIMLTAHALTPEALKKSIKLGAVFYLPKEKITVLREFLTDIVTGQRKFLWDKLFTTLGSFFDQRFGPDWKERDRFFKEFEKEIMESEK